MHTTGEVQACMSKSQGSRMTHPSKKGRKKEPQRKEAKRKEAKNLISDFGKAPSTYILLHSIHEVW